VLWDMIAGRKETVEAGQKELLEKLRAA